MYAKDARHIDVSNDSEREEDDLAVVFFFQAEDGIRDYKVTGVQTCALPISSPNFSASSSITVDKTRSGFFGIGAVSSSARTHALAATRSPPTTLAPASSRSEDRKSVV